MRNIKILILGLSLHICGYCQLDRNQKKLILHNAADFSFVMGKKFDSFSGKATDNRLFSDSSLNKKITLITFWFASCMPCRKEFNDLKRLYYKYQSNSDFQLMSFTFDPFDEAIKVSKTDSLPYAIIPISKILCTKLNFGKGYPTNFITDTSGRIMYAGGGRDIFANEDYFSKIIIPKLDSLLMQIKSN